MDFCYATDGRWFVDDEKDGETRFVNFSVTWIGLCGGHSLVMFHIPSLEVCWYSKTEKKLAILKISLNYLQCHQNSPKSLLLIQNNKSPSTKAMTFHMTWPMAFLMPHSISKWIKNMKNLFKKFTTMKSTHLYNQPLQKLQSHFITLNMSENYTTVAELNNT